ncbi:hypothetical protein KVT40_001638 [Elsinoe batatas]|uniref:BTB domain-containing protein n=1 Tax=Elsinoe batatas TaxID=2601811 RepID=A0A8K0L5D6_9PEZI|nr:hypothetical protein KVT40_001638 [Elsinoe batatas]
MVMQIDTPNASDSESTTSDLRRAPTIQFPIPRTILRTRFRKMHEMATVIVGPAQVKFLLHTELLVSVSPFFAAALQGHFAESSSQTVTLPEEKPEMFEWFVQWLYTGSLSTAGSTNCAPPQDADPAMGSRRSQEGPKRVQIQESHSDGDLRNSAGSPKYFLLIDLYALSDRLLTTSMSNHIIDTVARLSETTNSVPTPSDTWLLYGDCCSYMSLHHCACSTRRNSILDNPATSDATTSAPAVVSDLPTTAPTTAPTTVYIPLHPSHPPSKTAKVPHLCPIPTTNPGVRPSSPLRDLILDLFTYKKTDRLLQTHKDDWHPLFLRDLVVKMKRPGRDMIARHRMRDWRPRSWPEAKACEGCRSVVGPGGASQEYLAARAAAHVAAAAGGVPGSFTAWPAQPTRAYERYQRLTRARARRTGVQTQDDGTAVVDDTESMTGAEGQGGTGSPRFVNPQRCMTCDRVYCVECMIAAVEGRGLENGDSKFALTGGDVGPCKPWLNWDDLFGSSEEGMEEWNGMRAVERGPRGGVCGRYHEHGMLGGRMEVD